MKLFAFSLLAFGSAAAFAAQPTPLPDVAPLSKGQHVAINIPQQRLFLYTDGKLTKIYPVAVGKEATQTNLGRHLIGVKAYNPTWHIPKSIQKEMKNGQKTVPPGPNNPLGPVFVRMGDPKLGLGIHGTNAPASVPGVRSHGCVRMKSPDALEFAKNITAGTPVDVIYQLAALGADDHGNLWLAAFKDPYKRNDLDKAALEKSIQAWAQAHDKEVHQKRMAVVLKNRSGQLNCITCGSGLGKVAGELKPLAWTSGYGELAKPAVIPSEVSPKSDQVLPEGSEIEVDEEAPAASMIQDGAGRTDGQPASAPVTPEPSFLNDLPDTNQPDDATGNLF